MSTWKEKGVVPDSDEEDALDCGSTAASEDWTAEDLPDIQDGDNQHPSGPQKHEGCNEESQGWQNSQGIALFEIQIPIFSRQNSNPLPPTPTQQITTFPNASPPVLREFRNPIILGKLDIRHESTTPSPQASPSLADLPDLPRSADLEEQNSMSYVRLSTSPLTSLASSPIEPLFTTNDFEAVNAAGNGRIESRLDQVPTELNKESFGDGHGMGGHHNFEPFEPRSFRERLPIQLRPYGVESEKYRRTLMSAGMKPLKLAQVQEEHRRRAQDKKAEDMEFDEENEGQLLSAESLRPQSSPVPSTSTTFIENVPPVSGSNTHSRSADSNEDEEFPDVDQLVNQSKLSVSKGVKRKRTNEYSGPSRVRTYSGAQRARTVYTPVSHSEISDPNNLDVFDVPPSPPATSPPVSALFAKTAGRNRIFERSGSDRVTQLRRSVSAQQSPPAGYSPISVNSTVKESVDLTGTDLDDDNEEDNVDDPFISDVESSASSISQELAPPFQVKRVGKKIRGVLPASWLRLDQKGQEPKKLPPPEIRDSRSLSPIKSIPKRGVAVPKSTAQFTTPTTITKATGKPVPYFMSDESETDEDAELPSLIGDFAVPERTFDVYSQSDLGFAVEDDRVDAMLPTQRRLAKFPRVGRHQNFREVSTSLFKKPTRGRKRQAKITEHLSTPRSSDVYRSKARDPKTRKGRKRATQRTTQPERQRPPNLSILDVMPIEHTNPLPQFVRVAARSARLRRGLGRASPTRKYIKLADREDTQDAQEVLRCWREGTLQPRIITKTARPPLRQIVQNHQHRSFPLSTPIRKSSENPFVSTHHSRPQKVEISISLQARKTLTERPVPTSDRHSASAAFSQSIEQSQILKKKLITQAHQTHARPAQLETTEIEQSHRHQKAAFGSTKKALDALYRKAHKGSVIRGDVQLERFLADDDLLPQQPRRELPAKAAASNILSVIAPKTSRKRLPRRIDAGAARYRQPSEPLVLEHLQVSAEKEGRKEEGQKLLGLGEFGTQYTHHFDIFPLQLGVHFHKSTFIGSGGLSKAIEPVSDEALGGDRGRAYFQLGEKTMCWGSWDEIVSSEIGVCFDWIVDHMSTNESTNDRGDCSPLECMHFINNYIQNYLSLPSREILSECLFRLAEASKGMLDQLELFASNACPEHVVKEIIELSTAGVVFYYRVLQLSANDLASNGNYQQESLLKKCSTASISLLLQIGLDSIRDLYDDLQYLSFRESGIRSERYAAQAWIVNMHVLQAANITRFSFWNALDSQLFPKSAIASADARILERTWYSLFSLLPLVEFDRYGVLIPDRRRSLVFDSWAVPQGTLKRIFDIYASNTRQSSSFNDYIRANFTRCYHLMCAWGWRRQTSIVGTMFDFFALHKLENLRNEEVYKSPQFLEELHHSPSLDVEPEDRCFHIFLKIVASSIMQMRKTEDMKGIRNIITRLLPNHDRQYPKEETIHQRDLASLRNHHDLLCTLYWAAPSELRRPITLIRQLVNPEQSHKEAYLINLRTWTNLTRFILTSTPTPSEYEPFAQWQQDSFTQLLSQYHSIDADIADQLRDHPEKHLILQTTISETVRRNKCEVIDTIQAQVTSVVQVMQDLNTMEGVKLAFAGRNDIESLIGLSRLFDGSDPFTLPIITKICEGLWLYLTKLDIFVPSKSMHSHSDVVDAHADPDPDEDSQDYGGDVVSDFTRSEFIQVLDGPVLDSMRDMIRKCACIDPPSPRSYTELIVKTFALIAGVLVASGQKPTSDFISLSGSHSVLTFDDETSLTREYAPLFIYEFLRVSNISSYERVSGRNVLADWLCLLVKPTHLFHYEHLATQSFSERGDLWPIEKTSPMESYANLGLEELQQPNERLRIVVASFRKMHKILTSEDLCEFFYPSLSYTQVRLLFIDAVRRVMGTLEKDIHGLRGSNDEIDHKEFALQVILDIKPYFAKEYPFEPFLNATIGTTGTNSTFFVSTLHSYGLRVLTDRGKQELYHFILETLKNSSVDGTLGSMPDWLTEAMSSQDGGEDEWKDLTNQILGTLVPSFVLVAFETDEGWLLAEPLLKTAGFHLSVIAQSDNDMQAVEIARSIMGCIIKGLSRFTETYPMNSRSPISFEHLYVLVLVAGFINSTLQWVLHLAAQGAHDLSEEIFAVYQLFNNFATGTREYIRSPTRAAIAHWEDVAKRDILDVAALEFPLAVQNEYAFMDPYGIDELLTEVDHYSVNGANASNSASDFRSQYNGESRRIASLTTAFNLKTRTYKILADELNDIKHGIRPSSGLMFRRLFSISNPNELLLPALHAGYGSPMFSKAIIQDMKTNFQLDRETGRVHIKIGQKYQKAGEIKHEEEIRRSLFDTLLKELDAFAAEFDRQTGPARVSFKRNSREHAWLKHVHF